MPQMGESVAEGTVVRWMKKVGDKVDRDEALFEISTDKVDAEIPSPVAGVVREIRVKEGETVPVNSVVAVIGPAGEAKASAPAAPAPPAPTPQGERTSASWQEAEAKRGEGVPAERGRGAGAPGTIEDRIRERSSPLVRRIAKEHHLDISQLRGTGIAGRVTRQDILQHLGHTVAPSVTPAASEHVRGAGAPGVIEERGVRAPAVQNGGADTAGLSEDRVEKMSVMRKKIAEHMVLSRRTSAHVHSVFEVNFARVAQIRDAKKAEYERAGAKLTYLSFIVKVIVDALRAMPVVNASVDGDRVIYHKDVNIGIAVALDWGLIVPVIKNADGQSLLGLSLAIADVANRARAKQLKPEEVLGGTFTITNPGAFGALFGMPIINQPQVAILGVGNVEKRPIVTDDAITIKPMAYLTLGYDHRLIDGAVADQFMSHVKSALENWDPAAA